TRLLGGILVGDASDYGTLLMHSKSPDPLPVAPGELLLRKKEGKTSGGGVVAMADGAQVCSCNNVTKGQICQAIVDQGLATLGAVKSCTKAGTGCGGCVP